MIEPTHLDLFSGIGGFTLAFEAAGFRTIAFSETDERAARVLAKHWPNIPNLGDVRNVYRFADEYQCPDCGEPYCERHEAHFAECSCVGCSQFDDEYGSPAVITAGFPCQDISNAFNCGGTGKYDRKAQGLKGERSGLVWEAIRIVRGARPVFCLFENVPALRTKGADEILAALEAEGYAARAFVVGAWSLGADHKRERAFICAYDTRVGIQGLRPERIEVSHALAQTVLSLRDSNGQWKVEPDLRRAIYGVSDWPHRVREIGNAVIPQIIFPFARAMREALGQPRLKG